MSAKKKAPDSQPEDQSEVMKTPSGLTLPVVGGVPVISGQAITQYQQELQATVAEFASYLGVTPYRYKDIKSAGEEEKKKADQASVHIVLRLLITCFPELRPPEPVPVPAEVFKRLQKYIEITEENFAIMLGLSAGGSRRILAPGFGLELRSRIGRGSKPPLGPSALRLLRILNQLMDWMEEHPRKYRGALESYLQVVDEVAQERGMAPGAIWEQGSWERGPGPGDPSKLRSRAEEVKKKVAKQLKG